MKNVKKSILEMMIDIRILSAPNLLESLIVTAFNADTLNNDLKYKEIARYKSVTEAAEIIGCSRSAISKCCTRVNKTCQGYIFLYVEDIEKEREVS